MCPEKSAFMPTYLTSIYQINDLEKNIGHPVYFLHRSENWKKLYCALVIT